ncbi:uncharacterized protein KRP23_3951 [Phytophthora ramorum]|uniref:uncharacterized protein n=1 Tax=Phytophthora ramorum TaxID=164328 RepID=UPI0030A551BB|nr:hypothetical protein KRP23_3951 [Phytophthora ramorum]
MVLSSIIQGIRRPTLVQPLAPASSQIQPTQGKQADSRDAQPSSGPSAKTTRAQYKPAKLDIMMLGITIVIGGQYFCWNAGIASGFFSFLAAFFLIASAYTTLCCCTAEITGALPFAGGSYGLARFVGFQDNEGIEIITFSIIVTLLTIFYFGYAKKRQTFSSAENRVIAGEIVRHTNSIKPRLTDENKLSRLEFCLSFVAPATYEFDSLSNRIFIDERWFYMPEVDKTLYLASGEEPPHRTV